MGRFKRRVKDAGLPEYLSPHGIRGGSATDLLTQGVPLQDVQYLLGHADPRTTRFYDHRAKRVTRNIVERISLVTAVSGQEPSTTQKGSLTVQGRVGQLPPSRCLGTVKSSFSMAACPGLMPRLLTI